jgi:hypothetical protein
MSCGGKCNRGDKMEKIGRKRKDKKKIEVNVGKNKKRMHGD